jgi:S1-C subfamily serine protease
MGAAMPTVRGAASRGAAAYKPVHATVSRKPDAYAKALGRLKADARPATRGAAEVQVYQNASPAVVLIVTPDGLGSGALIGADGRIVTNLHVVGDYDEVGVMFKPKDEGAAPDEANVQIAKVLRRDEIADLALVQVDEVPAEVKPLTIGSVASVQVGADVHAIGHPTGESWTYTRGIVSQVRKDYEWRIDGRVQHRATVIQTQTPINPGNSGGPLLNERLEIIGINSFKAGGEGLNFAVSADDVAAFLARSEDRIDPAAKAAAECKAATVLAEDASTDPPGKRYLIDLNCDGKGDAVAIEPNNRREAGFTMIDGDGDGKIDMVLYDQNRDGDVDYSEIDTDHDGAPDMRGSYKKGESEPYKYERIRK